MNGPNADADDLEGGSAQSITRALLRQSVWRNVGFKHKVRLHRLKREFDKNRDRNANRRGVTLRMLADNTAYPGLDSEGSLFMNSMVDCQSLLADHVQRTFPDALTQAKNIKDFLERTSPTNPDIQKAIKATESIIEALDVFKAIPMLAPADN